MSIKYKKPLFVVIFIILFVFILSKFLPGYFIPQEKNEEKIIEINKTSGYSTKLPENFPADFPLYPDSWVDSSWTANESLSVVWGVNGGVSDVSGFYKKEFVEKGWEFDITSESEDSLTLNFKKNDKKGILGITKGSGATLITVAISLNYND